MIVKYQRAEFKNICWYLTEDNGSTCKAILNYHGQWGEHGFNLSKEQAFGAWTKLEPTDEEKLAVVKWIMEKARA